MGKVFRELVEALILALVAFFLIQTSVQNFQVEGTSMYPTIHPGQYLLVNKLTALKVDMKRFSDLIPFWDASDKGDVYPFNRGGPERGDIVVFHFPRDRHREFVKRVIGLPGEAVSIGRGQVYINGVPLNEPYITDPSSNETDEFKRLGPGEYFVMGDNRRYSSDSRHWGPVGRANIVGTKLLDYDLPFDLGIMSGLKDQ